MLRVYLDQNKWIDLARAHTGHRLGERFQAALNAAQTAVATGTASFPLDIYRFWESSKRGDSRSRNQVVDVMRELSRQHTIAPPPVVLENELDVALRHHFGRPPEPRRNQIFGTGLSHIVKDGFIWPTVDPKMFTGSDVSKPSTTLLAQANAALISATEEVLQRIGPLTAEGGGVNHAAFDQGRRFVEHEERIAAAIAARGLSGSDIDLAMRGTDFDDIRAAVENALRRIGVTFDQFLSAMSVAELVRFMDDLPTRYVTNVMRAAKHHQSQQKWHPNDFIDIVALPVAAVYCDVVISEKQWVYRMRKGRVDELYQTLLLSDTAQLVGVLAGTSRLDASESN